MPATPKLSVADKLLLAAASLPSRGRTPFTAEDLVVAAWKAYPDTFGLRGHLNPSGAPAYPDSNRVFSEIMGPKPLRKKGWITKVGKKQYKVTESGAHAAETIGSAGRAEGDESRSTLSRDIQLELQRLAASRAYEKLKNGRDTEITFHDACSFWSITPRSSAKEFEGRLANTSALLTAAFDAAQQRRVSLRHDGVAFGQTDLKAIQDLDAYLQDRFRDEIAVIRQRTDER